MDRRSLIGLAAVGAVTVPLAGCGGSDNNTSGGASTGTNTGTNSGGGTPVKGGTLNMLGSGDVDHFDQNVTYYTIGYLGLRMWARGLLAFPAEEGKTMTAAPDLAEEVPTTSNGGISSDGKTYTLKIRQGVKWNTDPARQVTAADVVRGLKRAANPVQPFGGIPDFADLIVGFQKYMDDFQNAFKSAKPTAEALEKFIEGHEIEGAIAKDDQTVVYKLTHAATYFTGILTLPPFFAVAKEGLKYVPASADYAQHTVSCGPYEVSSYNPTKKIEFARNPAWDASADPIRKAYVDKIVVNQTVSQDSTQQQLQTGSAGADMEWDNFPPPSQLPGLIAAKDPNLNLGETASSNPYLVFNMVSTNNDGLMKKLEFRQALEYGFNRSNMIQVLGGPKLNPPLDHVLPPNIDGSKEPSSKYDYNADKAKQMISKLGANGATIKVLYRNESEGNRKLFQVIQQDLSTLGLQVQGVQSPNADFYTKYLEVPSVAHRGVWDIAIAGWGADWYGDAAYSYFAPLFSGKPSFPPVGSNFGFYDDDQTNKLIKKAASAKSSDESAALWAQADARVMSQAAFFPITNPKQPNYHAKQANNAIYVPAIQNFDPTNIWLSKDQQGG